MIELMIGGIIAISSGVIVGIITPNVNTRFKNKRKRNKEILNLYSELYLIKNNLESYLYQEMSIIITGYDEEEYKRLNYLSEQININLNSLYSTQRELISFFKKGQQSIVEIYDILSKIDHFVWLTKQCYNNGKSVYDKESSDLYDEEIIKDVEHKFVIKINELIMINRKILKL